MLSLAQKEKNPELLLQAHHALWTTLIQVPDYERSQKHLEAGWKLYTPEMHHDHCRLYGGHDPGMCCQRAQCLSKWSLGFPDQAIQAGLTSVELSQSHYFSRMTAHMAVAFVYKQRGDIQPAQEQAEQIIQLANAHGFPGFVLWAEIIMGWCQGQLEWQSSSTVKGGLETMLKAVNQINYKDPGYMAMLAELYLLANRLEEGLKLLEELFEVVETKNEHNYEAELFRLKGEFLWKQALAQSEPLSSEAQQTITSCFRQSHELARTQGAKSLELRAAISLARLTKENGLAQEGQQRLQAVYDTFTEGFETHDLQTAKALLGSTVPS